MNPSPTNQPDHACPWCDTCYSAKRADHDALDGQRETAQTGGLQVDNLHLETLDCIDARMVELDLLEQLLERYEGAPEPKDLYRFKMQRLTDLQKRRAEVIEHNSKDQEATTDSSSLPKMPNESGGDTSLREQLDAIVFRCFAQGQYWGSDTDGKLDPDYAPEEPIDRTEAVKLLEALCQEIAREASELARLRGYEKAVSDMLATGYKPPQRPSDAPSPAEGERK